MSAAISLHNITLAYRRHPAVHHLQGEFAVGSLSAIVGPNGAGKSTLLNALAGLAKPDAGSVTLTSGSNTKVAYLPQQAKIDRSFPITVLDVVILGHWVATSWFRSVNQSQRQAANDVLGAVGLAGFEQRVISELSAGQFQRVLFARLLLQDAAIILLDEPFAAIDARTTADLLQVVHRWQAQAKTVIAVLHDLDQVREHFPQTLLLAREAIAWGSTASVLTQDNLVKSRRIAQAWDEAAPVCHREPA